MASVRTDAAADLRAMRPRAGNCETASRCLLLVPSYAKRGIEEDVLADRHPRMDYHALAEFLGGEIADYATVDADRSPQVRLAARAGKDAALAMHGFLRRREFGAIFSNGENVSIPLGLLLKTDARRPGHVLIGHHVSTPKKRTLLRALRKQIDGMFLYAGTQRDYAVTQLGYDAGRLHVIPFHADHRFYRPSETQPLNRICSAGLEWRDYPTLIEAVRGLDVEVCLAAASPWSKHANETERMELPPNVSARRYDYGELRDLYASSRFVVVPLYENDFQAGVTTILEAMAMGKAVIATRTMGQGDVIEDGENGLYVPPGDQAALRRAILRLLDYPEEASRLGDAARQTIVENMTLDHWVERIGSAVRAAQRSKHEERVP